MNLGLKSLPMELILSCILPKLPVKSLLRFKCVSKSFLAEISSPEFDALFPKANRLLIFPGDAETFSFSVYELDSPHSPPTVCPYPILSSERYAPVLTMVAYCESHILIACRNVRPNHLILLNPTTHIHRIIPTPYLNDWSGHIEYGMCHFLDEFNNDDFKIVRFSQYNDPNTDNSLREVMVYSLRTNSWKLIESEKPTTELIRNPILVQNHLLVMTFEDCYRCLMRIGCFDIKAERWSNDVLLSDILLGEIGPNPTRYCLYHLGVLEGQLRFSCYDMTKWTYSIWVMKDFGVKESWFKLMSVPGQGPEGFCHPIVYRKGSLHELFCMPDYKGKYLWYNLRDKQFTETGLDGYGLNRNLWGFAFIYKESMLNFPRGGGGQC
ncbi:F-box protein CPR1-like [Silene latifolia]|uniref:F-box protein CPR1-like n=1 Tax=Silene latifolia TaxID=37657 RepID=UPI003D782215